MRVDATHLVQEAVDGELVAHHFAEGQLIEGAAAALQVDLGHAEEVEDASPQETAQAADAEAAAAEVAATQAALDHAAANGIDIATIQGTGKDGKVTKADVEAALAAQGQV